MTCASQALRYGNEKEAIEAVEQNPGRNASDPRTENTDLHLVCSNPSITKNMLLAVGERRKRLNHGKKISVAHLKNIAGVTPVHHLCANLHVTDEVLRCLLEDICDSSNAAARGYDLSVGGSSGSTRTSSGVFSAEGEQKKDAPQNCTTSLHVYTRGLPIRTTVLTVLLRYAPESAALSDAGLSEGMHLSMIHDDELSNDFLERQILQNTKGLRPLHNVTYWPHLRINPEVVDSLFASCKAAANCLVEDDKMSTPLHIMCGTLTAMNVTIGLYKGVRRRTCYISGIPDSIANEKNIRERLGVFGKTFDCIEFARVRTSEGEDGGVHRWAVVRFKNDGAAMKAKQHGLDTKEKAEKESPADGWLRIEEFDLSLFESFEDRVAVEDLQAEADMQSAYRFGVQLGTRMLHQWRGQWKQRDVNILVASGIMEKLEDWIINLWQEAPSWLPAGRYIAVNDENGKKGMVIRDGRPKTNLVVIQRGFIAEKRTAQAAASRVRKTEKEKAKLRQEVTAAGRSLNLDELLKEAHEAGVDKDDIRFAEQNSDSQEHSREAIIDLIAKRAEDKLFRYLPYLTADTSTSVLLVCNFAEFLCQSNNPFEMCMNLMKYFEEDFRMTEAAANTLKRHYDQNVNKLREIVSNLAEVIPLRSNDESNKDCGYRLSTMLLQPGMAPAVLRSAENERTWYLSNNLSSTWQLSGGVLVDDGQRTVQGPLWIAVKQHNIAFTCTPWVQSYIDRCMDGQFQGGEVALSKENEKFVQRSFKSIAKKLIYTSIYDGWDMDIINYAVQVVLGRSGRFNPRAGLSLLMVTAAATLNPRTSFQAPALRQLMDTVFYIIFVAIYWTVVMAEGCRQASHDQIIDCGDGTPVWTIIFVLCQCLGLLYRVGRIASIYGLKQIGSDIFLVFDVLLAILILSSGTMIFVGGFVLDPNIGPHIHKAGHITLTCLCVPLFFRGFDYLRTNDSLGPLIRVIGKMTILLLSFMVLLVVIITGFACAISGLMYSAGETVLYPYGDGIDTVEPYFWSISFMLVRAMVGDFELSVAPFRVGDETYGAVIQLLMVAYVVFMIVLMMNLLIAVLSSAHAEMAAELPKEIAHTRTTLVVNLQDFINDHALPAPVNLLQIIHPDRKLMSEFIIIAFCVPIMCFVMAAVWITIGPILIVQHLFYRRQGRPAPKVTATLVLMYVGTPALVVWLLVAWLEGAARALMMVVTAYGSAAIDKVAVQKVRAQLRPTHFFAACVQIYVLSIV